MAETQCPECPPNKRGQFHSLEKEESYDYNVYDEYCYVTGLAYTVTYKTDTVTRNPEADRPSLAEIHQKDKDTVLQKEKDEYKEYLRLKEKYGTNFEMD